MIPSEADFERASRMLAFASPAIDWSAFLSPATRALMEHEHRRFDRMLARQPVFSNEPLEPLQHNKEIASWPT